MKYNEKISVVIPTYNRAKQIKKSVNSVLKQTYDNLEVIIVDDGSTDNTKDVIKKMQLKDSRIKFYSYKKNKGACYARNYGIKKSTGKYISFQDSDDVYINDKLEKQYNNMIKNNSDMDFCKIKIHSGNFNTVIPNDDTINKIKNGNYLDKLCEGNYISTQAILVKKEVIEKYMFDDNMPRFQDYDLVIRMIPNINVSFTKIVLVDLYRSNDSISSSNEKLYNTIIRMLEKEYSLNKKQRNNLNKFLINIYSNDITQKNEIYTNELHDLKTEYEKLMFSYKQLEEKYNSVINSKRWKFINKLLKLRK